MTTTQTQVTRTQIEDFLYYETRLRDDRRFEEWIQCYREDAEFWMPAWDDNGELTEDPQTEISLIFYPNRGGLEDRVFRIRTERSSATSLPEPRTSHNVNNVEILEQRDGAVDVRFNWITNYFRYNNTDMYYGHTFLTIDTSGEQMQIIKKKVVLQNDYIHHVIDIYHV